MAKLQKNNKLLFFSLCFFFLFGFFRMEAFQDINSNLHLYDGEVVELSGVVKKAIAYEKYASFSVDVKTCGKVGQEKLPVSEDVLIRLDLTQSDCVDFFIYDSVGREVTVKGKLSKPEGRRNPGSFDYALHLKGRGIYALCDVSVYQFKKAGITQPFYHFLSVKKGQFYELLKNKLGEQEFSLMKGILFGEKSSMQADLLQQFQLNGIAHVLAVSGLHVALLYAALLRLFSQKKGFKVSLVIVGVLFSYAALCNFSVSVMRAFGMVVMAIIARHLRCRYDLTTAASAMVILFLTMNPFQLFDSGLQLSFLAAYSLGIVLPYFNLKLLEISDHLKKEWVAGLGKFLAPCMVVQLSMSPLIAFHFLMFCPAGILMNPPSVALVGLLLPVGLLMFCVSFFLTSQVFCFQGIIPVLNILFSFLGHIADFLCAMLLRLSAVGSKLGIGNDTVAPPLGLLLLFYLIYFLFFSEMRFISLRRNRKKLFSLFLSILLLLGCCVPKFLGITSSFLPWKYDTALITFLDVGQGDSIHIQAGDVNILIDGGGHYYTNIGEKILVPYLLKNGIDSIDLGIVTHSDMDHRKGMEELSSKIPIERLVVSSPYEQEHGEYSNILCGSILYASAGTTISCGEDILLSVVAPPSSLPLLEANNENSLVIRLSYQGLTLLLTGDVGMESEEKILKDAPCDILKIAHHGSAYSTSREFLDAAKPSCCVISCGKNNIHGHPSLRVIELLENSGIMTCRTDHVGAVCLRKITKEFFIIQNAAKEKVWKIFRKEPLQ